MGYLDIAKHVHECGVQPLTPQELLAARNFESPEYERLCDHLGFDSHARFISVSRSGKISFTLGKPEEVKSLRLAAKSAGYPISKGLLLAGQ